MKVVIAEDDAISRRLLDTILRKWGYEVVIAQNGGEAWEELQKEDAPRLAILDWMMPELDGTEVCTKVRERKNAPYVYILLLSAKSQREDLIKGMESGADAYITKPFDANELKLRLRAGHRILGLEEAIYTSIMSPKAIEFYSVFISYSSKDDKFAKKLHGDLQARGILTWFAPENVKTGDPFRLKIDEAIRLYDKLLVILSDASIRSTWVEAEVEAAFERERFHKTLCFFLSE
jgi:CheY-like chemotaxis protein